MIAGWFSTFVFFFAVIDPIGTVPVFLAVTRKHAPEERKKIALHAAWISAAILLFFVIAGEIILKAINIPLEAFQIAGGIVLFLFALSMIFGEAKPEEEIKLVSSSTSEKAVYPLAVPSIASPGAMLAAVLLTENHRYNFTEQVITSVIMLLVVGLVYIAMLFANRLHRVLGDTGASIISRVMGLMLTSVAVSNVLAGIKAYFGI
ncbi:MarC family protein [Pontiellaceae bacterium B12227]|nr:MarC family protein [Pontiellaceae bacterium B12227]